jgi:hypothetical protein
VAPKALARRNYGMRVVWPQRLRPVSVEHRPVGTPVHTLLIVEDPVAAELHRRLALHRMFGPVNNGYVMLRQEWILQAYTKKLPD